uniref:Uncharacterized protein n=1 Tax=Cacopsylla melanoneura TaxID=428564 RepID=A0A8D8RKJ4_9HEMI
MASLLSEVYKKMPYLHHGGKFCQLTHTNVNKRKKEKWQHRRLKLRETKYNINYVVVPTFRVFTVKTKRIPILLFYQLHFTQYFDTYKLTSNSFFENCNTGLFTFHYTNR